MPQHDPTSDAHDRSEGDGADSPIDLRDPRATRRVLIVDDSEPIRRMLRVSLELADGIEVVGEAEDGSAALAMIGERSPDVVILDNHMPVMTGVEMLAHLRGTDGAVADTVIVMFTSDPMVEEQAVAAGADAVLIKGDTGPREIAEAVTEVRRHSRR